MQHIGTHLRRSGFAIVAAPKVAQLCEAALDPFVALQNFRYPLSHGAPAPSVDLHYRNAFNSVYQFAASSLHAACGADFPLPPSSSAPYSMDGLQTEPFAHMTNGNLPFSASFFSLFNYNHGFLNIHVDRGLVTAVYAKRSGGFVGDQVRLWCRPHCTNRWLDVDAAVDDLDCDGAVVLFVGEQLEAASGGAFRAITHGCLLDPTAERIDTRLNRHPGARESGNRASAALVLCKAEEDTI